MSDELHTDELVQLKAEADALGIKYSPRVGITTLQQKITEAKEGTTTTMTETTTTTTTPKTEVFSIADYKKKALRLVRCSIVNLDPNDHDLQGAIVSVSNAYIDSSKFVPFKPEQGSESYHLPQCIVDTLRDIKYPQVRQSKNSTELVTEYIPKFNIIELPPLTEEELKKLAEEQAAGNRI